MMKPYFKAGNNYKDFIQVWLDEEVKEINLTQKQEKGLYEKYILIKPDSKFYLFSRCLFLLTCLMSFIFIPYVVMVRYCKLDTPYHEITVTLDALWILHMIQEFQFGFKRDSQMITSFWKIAKRYFRR